MLPKCPSFLFFLISLNNYKYGDMLKEANFCFFGPSPLTNLTWVILALVICVRDTYIVCIYLFDLYSGISIYYIGKSVTLIAFQA